MGRDIGHPERRPRPLRPLHHHETRRRAKVAIPKALEGGGARLQAVLEAFEAEGPPVSVVYDVANRSSAKVRVFADFVTSLFRAAVERQPRSPVT